MSNLLVDSIQYADGRYLDDQELRPFESLVQSYTVRLAVYQKLQSEAKTLVINALRRVIQTKHRKAIQEHGAKCQRDMQYTLECIAKAVLLDDTEGFVEEYVVWMQNITRALHKEDSAIDAYQALQEEIKTSLSGQQAMIVNSHLDKLIEAISSGM